MLGDAGRWKKSQPHQPSIGIPLVVAGPGIAVGRATDQPATFLDLHATMIDLAAAQPLPDIDSRSLLPVLADPSRQVRDVVFSGLGHWRIAFDGTFKVVAGFDPTKKPGAGTFTDTTPENWRLVRVGEDPAETGDLSSRYPEVAARLKTALQAEVARAPRSVI
jgi:arylsulfatase A-like enzyme